MANVKAAKEFVKRWKIRGDEKQETQAFWIELLDKVYEDHDYMNHVLFEQVADKVEGGSNFKDVVINRYSDHAVLIEQKSSSLALDKPEPRFGTMVTPFEQAKHYDDLSAVNDKARWIITCNFREFWIYDMLRTGKNLTTPVAMLALDDLPNHLDWLNIISPVKTKPLFIDEVAVSNEAGRLVGVMYDALRKRYADPESEETAKSLNKLCVRIVFCLYAEDSGLFNKNNRKIFHDYLSQFDAKGMRKGIRDLFRVLNQREDERDKYLADDDPLLASFPYVNGGLFEGDVEIPPFDDEIRDILLVKESMGFDWSVISPTIFGAVFESTLNPETRRQGGMHYTSIENIHKVIDPLFLDDLTIELNEILKGKQVNVREKNLLAFQEKMAGLKFLDPAAGSGNFLTETYLSLRKLENRAIQAIQGERVIGLGFEGDAAWIKVSIQQFYGIEINDFAVAVAKTALWIAEAQMFEKTQEILSSEKEFLPLHEYDNIKEGNALRMDWNDVVPASELNYLMGNPPFSGTKKMGVNQKNDAKFILGEWKNYGTLDYVSCWYKKTINYIENTNIKCALVSTNSICQGEQVINLWKPLMKMGLHIDFAYPSFEWKSEASDAAAITCIIIGFSVCKSVEKKKIYYSSGIVKEVDEISPYLTDSPTIFIENRQQPISNVPPIYMGTKPLDGGYYVMDEAEMLDFIKQEPKSKPLIRPYMMGKDFINRKPRYIIWLQNADPELIKACPKVVERIKLVREFRKNCDSPDTNKYADRPQLPARLSYYSVPRNTNAIAIPKVTTLNRDYIPMDYLPPEIISGDKLFMMPNATLFHFGVLMSNVHNYWVKAIAGRMRDSGYSYSNTLVYNNFCFPPENEKTQNAIEKTAQEIIDARNIYPNASYMTLYDPITMPMELRKAHEANDKAVMEAYGFKKGMSESEIVAELMKMYQKLTATK